MKIQIDNKQIIRGFTLVELLVVLVIISVLMGVGASVMKSATTAQGVSTAVPIAEGVFNEARTLAKSRGLHTRVVIPFGADQDNHDKNFRYLGIVEQEVNSSGEPQYNGDSAVFKNRLSSRGKSLPGKTFFNANLSSPINQESYQIPGESSAVQCYYYEFNAEGYLVDADSTSGPSGSVVIQSGRMAPHDTQPKALNSNSRDAGGFAIWKRGSTSIYRSVDQIPELTGNPTF
ncbi:prepilin-type N-terminal cleavage/methylation domain-containing protein [Rubritalea sp.]|uniref:prepilin-type N-terminal cleavage/methylation domain-containing protein n=1 Tax=Rubritalea sp. TaxID=2109375 RepID=UPI003EF2EAA9